jgi:hypothetical protein
MSLARTPHTVAGAASVLAAPKGSRALLPPCQYNLYWRRRSIRVARQGPSPASRDSAGSPASQPAYRSRGNSRPRPQPDRRSFRKGAVP